MSKVKKEDEKVRRILCLNDFESKKVCDVLDEYLESHFVEDVFLSIDIDGNTELISLKDYVELQKKLYSADLHHDYNPLTLTAEEHKYVTGKSFFE